MGSARSVVFHATKLKIKFKIRLNFVICNQCEINLGKDYTFTLLAKKVVRSMGHMTNMGLSLFISQP